MTSDKASLAAMALGYALGEKRVSLTKLTPLEFDELLSKMFREIDLRELRGFKTLQDFLSRRPGSFVTGQRQNPLENVEVSSRVKLKENSRVNQPFDLKTQVVSVSRGTISQIYTYRRYESGEETTDHTVAHSWRDGYVHATEMSELVLRRPRDFWGNDLFEVWYQAIKVPHKDKMEIGLIKITLIPIANFRKYFGSRYPRIARDLIWEAETLTRRTLGALQSQVTSFQKRAADLERLAGSIME